MAESQGMPSYYQVIVGSGCDHAATNALLRLAYQGQITYIYLQLIL